VTAAVQPYADDPTLRLFDATAADYLARNRHHQPVTELARNAKRAALAAVRSEWQRHPGQDEDTSDLVLTADRAHKDQLVAQGWTCLGASTQYVLAPPGWQPPSTDPASPVDGGP
jgi:hypothetical protein